MEAFKAWLSQLNLGGIADTILIVLASLLCITIHECSHGYVAYRLGDPTAKNQGRLTLNPLKHIDIWGLVMMAIFKFGWAKPVPVDMRYFKNPKTGMAVTALAGPVSNLILAFLFLIIRAILYAFYDGGAVLSTLITFCEYVAVLNVGLAIFNVIPIPPLDGSKVLFSFLPDRVYYKILKYERYGFIILMAILWLGFLDTPLDTARTFILDSMSRASRVFYDLFSKIGT